jgi:Asp-tRNA(Asn)/Glu-tRNA(Gln) amidotransferase C subunit
MKNKTGKPSTIFGEKVEEKDYKNVAFDDLRSVDTEAVKRCAYPSCEAEIPETSQFPYCEKCRSFASRNAVALVIDPCNPKPLQRAGAVVSTLLTNLSAAEILETASRMEFVYLEFQKVIKQHNLEATKARPFLSPGETVESIRKDVESRSIRAKQVKKAAKKKETNAEKMARALGISVDDAKKYVDNSEFSDL